jgi:hypothetical protein
VSQETSLLFSLEELAHMEEQRIQAQARAAEGQRAAAEAAARQALEQERAERHAREDAAARRLEEEQRVARSEAARDEAMRAAATEAARASVEASARERERERERSHELEMARVRSRPRRTGPATAGAIGGALASAAIVASVLVAQMNHQAAEAGRDRESRLQTIGELRTELAAAAGRLEGLEHDLASQRDANRLLAQELDAARRQGAKTTGSKAPPRAADRRDAPEPGLDLPRCPPGSLDPMCLR